MHLVIFEAPTFHFIRTLKDYYLWFFMITLRWTVPNNGIRMLAPNTSKMVNKILFWINYLSFYLTTAKIKYEKPKRKWRYTLACDQGKLAFWLGRSGAAGAVMAFILNHKNNRKSP